MKTTITIKHGMKIETFPVSVSLYNRDLELGIDFNNSKSQIILTGVTAAGARSMIRELEVYIKSIDKTSSAEIDRLQNS